MIKKELLETLKTSKNLLAFSAGADSTALFYLLLEYKIPFDIAIVNYNTRSSSADEEKKAYTIAKENGLTCYSKSLRLDEKNFEHNARVERYNFFNSLILEHNYTNLLTAHHLGDRLEWFLMQLSRGAGLYELLGISESTKESTHNIVRPLLHLQKSELIEYLNSRNITWFEDETNLDESYDRNLIRSKFASPLLEKSAKNILKSFEYLEEDLSLLIEDIEVKQVNKLFYFKTSYLRRGTIVTIDQTLKRDGFLMRRGDKEDLKTKDTLVVGRKYVVNITSKYTFIAPFIEQIMSKEFKEKCRSLNIEPKLRPYLFNNEEAFEVLKNLV
ncbi:MAG: tRNA lysidine(34) synthetase TilS [Helicobacteraceae bacterium]|nr:tRNA lysidine(34) synthetase TilS [Helicobacteraceae bacterium]